ncbi:MAG TPA: IS110 family transposase [Armatimonadota bacterium]|nr:IS110 family transposase [Armatimonadota bacterium]
MKSIAYVGLDVHKEFIVAVALPEKGDEPILEKRIANDSLAVKKLFVRLERTHEPVCCYEASSCGYVVHRWLAEMGIACDVVAPSLIPKKPGDKVKTDRRDARKLAKLHRAGELTKVHVPSEEDESVRSLVRCRETMVKEVQKSRHYVLKFLSARGLGYLAGSNWTKKHWNYLKGLKFEGADEITWRQYLTLLEYKLSQLEELNRQLAQVAEGEPYKQRVGKLGCLRGVGTQTAMVLISEVQDFSRFASPRALMAYFGLVPSEESSGGTTRRGGITKTGNSRARRVLVEAAWQYAHKPALSDGLKKRQEGQPVEVIAHSWKAQHRLHNKFWRIALKKERCKAATAVARELTGFVWALMTQYEQREASAA